MKKLLLSLTALAASTSAFAQIAASNNHVDTLNNTAVYNFDGTAYDNYGTRVSGVAESLVPSSFYSDKGYNQDAVTFGDGTLTLNKNNKFSYNKMVILFATPAVSNNNDYGQPKTLDLSAKSNQYFRITLHSCVDVPQFLMFFLGENGGSIAYNDNATNFTSLKTGENIVEFSGFDWNQFGSPADKSYAIDSTKIQGFAMYFRTAYNDANPYTATIKIDKIEIGGNVLTRLGPDSGSAALKDAVICVDGIVDYMHAKTNSTVFPNPVAGNEPLTVAGLSGNVSLKLINSTGNIVTSSESNSLQLNNVNAGLYFLEVNNNGTIRTEKVMVK